MNALRNKIDFALVFTATNANPNGDPLDGNRPRTVFSGKGEVSDVCLKRKIRNRIQDMGEYIFVQSDDRRSDEYRSLKDRADACPALIECNKRIKEKKATRDEYMALAEKTWYDVRAFGQVFAFKGKKPTKDREGSDSVSIGIRGPVTIQSALSHDLINITGIQITKSVNLESGDDPDEKHSDTMGMKQRVDFGLYTTFGSINVKQAEKTGFSQEDAELLKKALLTLFVNDETSARPAGSMEVVRLIWWKHDCELGKYSSVKVHRSLKISLKDGVTLPSAADDYRIYVEPLPGLEFEELEGE